MRLGTPHAQRKVPDRSLYETYLLERLKAAAAVALFDDAAAVAALEASLKTGKAASPISSTGRPSSWMET